MKKILFFFLFFAQNLAAQSIPAPIPPEIEAKSWLLWDLTANKTLAAFAPQERLEPASLTKLMTAYLAFAALKEGRIALEQKVQVSEKAYRAEGSRMFLEINKSATVDDLLKGMIVQSGNDASILLAEVIGGSEENFAQLMNLEAKRLGLNNTHFENATGLPSNTFSTALDLAILTRALIIDFPQEYARYYAMREFTYNKIRQPNRNRLLTMDKAVDGVKTGHTQAAGYCLISSAFKDNRRLLAVLLGATSEKKRISESHKLLQWGYGAFELVSVIPQNTALANLRIFKGEQQNLAVKTTENLQVLVPRGMVKDLTFRFIPKAPLTAPIAATDIVGEVEVLVNNQLFEKRAIVAGVAVNEGGFLRRNMDGFLLWWNN